MTMRRFTLARHLTYAGNGRRHHPQGPASAARYREQAKRRRHVLTMLKDGI